MLSVQQKKVLRTEEVAGMPSGPVIAIVTID